MTHVNRITDTSRIREEAVSEKDVEQFIMEKFEKVKKANKIRNLIDFQATNKYMIMVHSQEELKILGRIVASYKKISLNEIFKEYEIHLKTALENIPSVKTHANVIMHIYGYFSKNLNQHEKNNFIDILGKFRKGKNTIGVTLNEISNMVFRFNNTYLANQTYFLLYSNSQSDLLFKVLNNMENQIK